MASLTMSCAELSASDVGRVRYSFRPSVEDVELWVKEAMAKASVEEVDPGCFVAEVEGVRGARVDRDSADEAFDALPDVLFDWAILAIRDGDRGIPVFGQVNLSDPGQVVGT